MMNPQTSLLANQYENGIPMQTLWDYYGMKHNPILSANHPFVPDTPDAYGGQAYTHIAPPIPFDNPNRLIVWNYNQNYQGLAPMDLQPVYNPAPPWESMA